MTSSSKRKQPKRIPSDGAADAPAQTKKKQIPKATTITKTTTSVSELCRKLHAGDIGIDEAIEASDAPASLVSCIVTDPTLQTSQAFERFLEYDETLPHVVGVCSRSMTLKELADHLRRGINPTRALTVLKRLLEWLFIIDTIPAKTVRTRAPLMPDESEIAAFVVALIEGCLRDSMDDPTVREAVKEATGRLESSTSWASHAQLDHSFLYSLLKSNVKQYTRKPCLKEDSDLLLEFVKIPV